MVLTVPRRDREAERVYQRVYYETHKESVKARRRKYLETHREQVAARQRVWRAAHKKVADDASRHYRLMHKSVVAQWRRVERLKRYGLTLLAFEQLLAAQDGQCAICRIVMEKPCVDHDHLTGKVRGLLCFNCNTSIGKFHDDPVLLKRALDYVVRGGWS